MEGLKAEHPALNLNAIARISYVRLGRRSHLATIRNLLGDPDDVGVGDEAARG